VSSLPTAAETPQATPRGGPFGWLWRILHSKAVGQYVVVAFLIAVAFLFGVRGMRFFLVPSQSMEPTLAIGDQVMTLRHSIYERGDIIVVWDAIESEHIVKRLVGLPGDRIEIHDGALFLNGQYASEPYIAEPMHYALFEAFLVPEGEVYLLGDNRNNSEDSHNDGRTFPMSDIVGRVHYIYFPYARVGSVPSYPLDRMLIAETSAAP